VQLAESRPTRSVAFSIHVRLLSNAWRTADVANPACGYFGFRSLSTN